MWASAGHLSYILGLPLVLPLILYIWQKDRSPFVAEQAKQATLMHLVMTVLGLIGGAFAFFTLGLGIFVVVPVMLLLLLVSLVWSVMAVMAIGEGKSYRYPVIGDWLG